MRDTLLDALSHPNERLRILAANLIATVVRRSSLPSWGALLPQLVQRLSTSKEAREVLGASLCLRLVTEDTAESVVMFPKFEEQVLPVVIRFVAHPAESVRSDMIQCVACFARQRMPLQRHLPAAMAALARQSKDPSHRVRRQVARAICQIVNTMVNALFPQMDKVIDYFV